MCSTSLQCKAEAGGSELCMGRVREIQFETLTHGRENLVTHDTVIVAGYAEQCVVKLTYPNVHHTGPLDGERHH